MACPYFWPEAPVDGARVARAPLGGIYSGQCRAGAPAATGDACNFGYPAGRCDYFPGNAACDALRYSTSRDTQGDQVEVVYVLEKNYFPHSHGRLTFSRELGGFAERHDDAILLRQASLFLSRWIPG